jgi:hypothetical protein
VLASLLAAGCRPYIGKRCDRGEQRWCAESGEDLLVCLDGQYQSRSCGRWRRCLDNKCVWNKPEYDHGSSGDDDAAGSLLFLPLPGDLCEDTVEPIPNFRERFDCRDSWTHRLKPDGEQCVLGAVCARDGKSSLICASHGSDPTDSRPRWEAHPCAGPKGCAVLPEPLSFRFARDGYYLTNNIGIGVNSSANIYGVRCDVRTSQAGDSCDRRQTPDQEFACSPDGRALLRCERTTPPEATRRFAPYATCPLGCTAPDTFGTLDPRDSDRDRVTCLDDKGTAPIEGGRRRVAMPTEIWGCTGEDGKLFYRGGSCPAEEHLKPVRLELSDGWRVRQHTDSHGRGYETPILGNGSHPGPLTLGEALRMKVVRRL